MDIEICIGRPHSTNPEELMYISRLTFLICIINKQQHRDCQSYSRAWHIRAQICQPNRLTSPSAVTIIAPLQPRTRDSFPFPAQRKYPKTHLLATPHNGLYPPKNRHPNINSKKPQRPSSSWISRKRASSGPQKVRAEPCAPMHAGRSSTLLPLSCAPALMWRAELSREREREPERILCSSPVRREKQQQQQQLRAVSWGHASLLPLYSNTFGISGISRGTHGSVNRTARLARKIENREAIAKLYRTAGDKV